MHPLGHVKSCMNTACRCLQEDKGQLRTTIHLLPDEEHVLRSITDSFEDVKAGRLPDFPTMEWWVQQFLGGTGLQSLVLVGLSGSWWHLLVRSMQK